MKRNTSQIKIKAFLIAVLLIILTCAQLPAARSLSKNSSDNPGAISFCLGNDEWENS